LVLQQQTDAQQSLSASLQESERTTWDIRRPDRSASAQRLNLLRRSPSYGAMVSSHHLWNSSTYFADKIAFRWDIAIEAHLVRAGVVRDGINIDAANTLPIE
jgi:hypothetical protein